MATVSSVEYEETVSVAVKKSDDKELGEEGFCLICQEKETNGLDCPRFVGVNDVQVYFLLRRVLELPPEQLEGYLRHCPFPEEWVKICGSCCTSYVRRCREIFEELVEAKRRFVGARRELIEAVRKSKDVGGRGEVEEEQLVFDIGKETRRFVRDHDYGNSLKEPEAVEVLLSSELLSAKTNAKAVKNASVEKINLSVIIKEEKDLEEEDEEPENITVKVDPLYLKNENDVECDRNLAEEPGSPGNPDFSDDSNEASQSENDRSSSSGEYDDDWNPDANESQSAEEKAPQFEDDKQDKKPSNPKRKPRGRRKSKNAENFGCPQCDKHFPTSGQLKNHIHWRHGKLNRGLTCPTCQKSFPSRKGCRAHIRRVHEHKGRFQCKQCSKDFSEHDKYTCHMRTVHHESDYPKYSCTFTGCEKSFPYKHQLNVHEKSHKPPEFKCDICGELFRYKQGLQFHKMKHDLPDGMKPFRCVHCPAQYSQKVKLVTHLKEKHNQTIDGAPIIETEVHSCHICGKILATKASLQGHLKMMHERSSSKVCCDLCGKLLKQASLPRHIEEVHTNKESKPYKCEDCGKGFTSKSTLAYVHKKVCPAVLNPNKILKPFQCEECGKGFAVKNYLHLHRKIHEKKQQQH